MKGFIKNFKKGFMEGYKEIPKKDLIYGGVTLIIVLALFITALESNLSVGKLKGIFTQTDKTTSEKKDNGKTIGGTESKINSTEATGTNAATKNDNSSSSTGTNSTAVNDTQTNSNTSAAANSSSTKSSLATNSTKTNSKTSTSTSSTKTGTNAGTTTSNTGTKTTPTVTPSTPKPTPKPAPAPTTPKVIYAAFTGYSYKQSDPRHHHRAGEFGDLAQFNSLISGKSTVTRINSSVYNAVRALSLGYDADYIRTKFVNKLVNGTYLITDFQVKYYKTTSARADGWMKTYREVYDSFKSEGIENLPGGLFSVGAGYYMTFDDDFNYGGVRVLLKYKKI